MTETALADIAAGLAVAPQQACLDTMQASHRRIERAIAEGEPVYGVTTGLGPKVTQRLSADDLSTFSVNTVRGRAHAVGKPLSKPLVRAALAIRLNTLLGGASGASPAVAQHIAACLNADLIPHIGGTTSTGPADLMWGGSLGLALIGEGRFLDTPPGQTAADALHKAGIAPLSLGPRDGLALVSHSSVSAAHAALGLHAARSVWDCAQTAAALSLEGFRGNLTPFRADVLALNAQPGARDAAKDLLDRLDGSELLKPGTARRLQDPLSFRNIAQIHGSLYAALDVLQTTSRREINGASDSPVVLLETDEIVSSGNFLNPYLTIALTGATQAMVQMAAQMNARIARLLSGRFTDLPNGLNAATAGNAGLGPLTKISDALFAEIAHLATPPPIHPSASADGVEDTISYSAIAGRALIDIGTRMTLMTSIEMIIAAQAIRLRNIADQIAPSLKPTLGMITDTSPPLEADRPLAAEIEKLADQLAPGPAL